MTFVILVSGILDEEVSLSYVGRVGVLLIIVVESSLLTFVINYCNI